MAIHREGADFTTTTAVVVVEPGVRLTIFGVGSPPIQVRDLVILLSSPTRWRAVEVRDHDGFWSVRLRPAPTLAVVAGADVTEFWPRSTPYPVLPPRSTPPAAA